MAERERSIHEMLKDTPSMNDSCGAVHTGTEGGSLGLGIGGLSGSSSSHSIGIGGIGSGIPLSTSSSLPLRNHSGKEYGHLLKIISYSIPIRCSLFQL